MSAFVDNVPESDSTVLGDNNQDKTNVEGTVFRNRLENSIDEAQSKDDANNADNLQDADNKSQSTVVDDPNQAQSKYVGDNNTDKLQDVDNKSQSKDDAKNANVIPDEVVDDTNQAQPKGVAKIETDNLQEVDKFPIQSKAVDNLIVQSTEPVPSPDSDSDLLVTFKVIVNKSGVYLVGVESTPAKLDDNMKETQIDLTSDDAIGKIQEIITNKYSDKILPGIEQHLQNTEEQPSQVTDEKITQVVINSAVSNQQPAEETTQATNEQLEQPDVKTSQALVLEQPDVKTNQALVSKNASDVKTNQELVLEQPDVKANQELVLEQPAAETKVPGNALPQQPAAGTITEPDKTPEGTIAPVESSTTDAAVEEEIKTFENKRFKPKYLIIDKTICVKPNNSRRIRNPDVKCSISGSEKGYSCELPTLFTTPSCIESSYGDNNATSTPNKPSIMSSFNGQPENGLSKMLKSFWKITRKYNGVEDPGVLKLWLLEYEELLRNYHDANFKTKEGKSYDKTKLLSKTKSINPFGKDSKGYDAEIQKKQTEFDAYIAEVEKFKLPEKLTLQKAPEFEFPPIIIGYKLGKDGAGNSQLMSINSKKIIDYKISEIRDISKKQKDISEKFNEINKTTSLFFEKIQLDLYIYYAFCKLYGVQVDSSYDGIISNIQKIQIYIISQTSRVGLVVETINKHIKILSSKTPTDVELKDDKSESKLDANELIKMVYDGYKVIMGIFYTQHKKKLEDFKNSLNAVGKKIKSTYSELNAAVNSSKWNMCQDICKQFNDFNPTVDAKYKILLEGYDRTKSELPMCRSNKMQTLTTMVKTSVKTLAIGTGSVVVAGSMTVLSTGFVVLVILPTVVGGVFSILKSRGGSSKNRRSVKRSRTHTHKRNV